MVRLYIGGLAPDITAVDLQQRFVSFGAVQDCEVRPPKPEDTSCSPGSSCRGFGYVDLEVKDDAALRRCLSQYNGCKWRGRVLRVEPAKVSFLETRKREREEDELAELEESIPQKAAASKDAHVVPFTGEKPLELVQPDGKPITTKPGKRKTNFPLTRTVPLEQLSWVALPTPSGAQRRAAAEALAQAEDERRARVASHVASHAQDADAARADIAGGSAEDGQMGAGMPQEKAEVGLNLATRKQDGRSLAKKQPAAIKERSMSPAWSDSSDSLAAVDFVSAAEAPVQSRRTDLSRFEESDDDEPPRVGKPSKPGKPTLKRRRGEDPSKAEKASARKADVAAVVDQILAAKAKKEAKGLKTKTSKLTEKAPASLRMPAASQDQGKSSVMEASQSSATSPSSSASEPSSGADARLAKARAAASLADDPEAEALWAAQGGIDSYLAGLVSEDDGARSRADAPESASDVSSESGSEQLAGNLSHDDDEAGLKQMRGGLSREEEAESGQQAGSSEDIADKDPGALWEAQGGLKRYLAALGRNSDAEPGSVDNPAEESKEDGNASEQQQATSSDNAHIAATSNSSDDSGSIPPVQEGALDADRDDDEAFSNPAPDSLAEDEEYPGDNPAMDAADQEDRLAEEDDLDDSLAMDGKDAGDPVEDDEEVQEGSADQQLLSAADAAVEDAMPNEVANGTPDHDVEEESSGEDGGQAAEDTIVESSFEGLDAGANFWAGGAGAEKLEAEWQRTREQLASSWKAKRRDALRHAQGGMAKKKRR